MKTGTKEKTGSEQPKLASQQLCRETVIFSDSTQTPLTVGDTQSRHAWECRFPSAQTDRAVDVSCYLTTPPTGGGGKTRKS